MKAVFFGSSDFSIYALNVCRESGLQFALIVTTPPQKKGRGLVETPTPVQLWAEEHKIPFIAPANLKSPELLAQVQTLAPELFIVASYGKIIPASWLKIPKYALNVHPSLLPKYRGAAPINWPIILGDTETGVCIAELTPELDAGDVFHCVKISLPPDSDSKQMAETLGKESAKALKTVLQQIPSGLKRTPQEHANRNYARKLAKEDGRIDWNRSAAEIVNQIRGLLPWPVASIPFQSEPLQILKASVISKDGQGKAGSVVKVEPSRVQIQCGKGILALDIVKPAGKKEMSGGDFARGRRLEPGTVLESSQAPDFNLKADYK